LIVAVVAGCGVQPDARPREVPVDLQVGRDVVSSAGAASGDARIYLVGPGDDRLLRSVARDPEAGQSMIDVLLAGPNDAEVGYATAIPAGLRLNARPRQLGAKLVVDVTPELLELSGTGLVQALAQIVYTANELDGVRSVEIKVDGESRSWPTADLDTTSDPLTIYDYPGIARSAQPDYPSLPSGGT
jgi:hypothetical protein